MPAERCFLDTNVLIYSASGTEPKKRTALELLDHRPVISVQVLNEAANVLRRKLGYSHDDITRLIVSWVALAEVCLLTERTVLLALALGKRYLLSHYDALIVAAALAAGCAVLYSEDLQHGQVLEGSLRVINPFLTTDEQAP